jgi:hypothetical protein
MCEEPAPEDMGDAEEIKKYLGFFNFKGEPDEDWYGSQVS